MDSVCHIYKQMRAPYCFDIKIGIERTDARKKKDRKRGDGPKRTSFTSHDGPRKFLHPSKGPGVAKLYFPFKTQQ